MRVFGLSGSGMDIDQIVGDMMKVERDRRVTKLEQKKEIDLWKQEMYQDINRDFANFIIDARKDFGLSSSTSSGTLINKSSDSFTWVKSASSTDETKITATSTAKALNGSYKLKVDRLAENVSKTSTASISLAGKSSSDTLFDQFGDVFDSNSIDGVSSDNLTFTIKTNKTDAAGVSFDFDPTVNTLDDVIDAINDANIGVQAAYDSDLDRFFLNTTETGEQNYFNIDTDTDNFFAGALKLNVNIAQDYNGIDAKFDFGDAVDIIKSSNTFSINGINISLKGTHNKADANDYETISVDTDVDAVYEKISNFVDKYNNLIGELNAKLGEKIYRDYQPLTSEEKEALSEDEVKLWEEKSKSGLLKNDSILSKMLTGVREDLYESVSGLSSSMNHLTQIGIETGEYAAKGKLIINETDLKDAIIKNASGVIDLLFNEPENYTDDEDKHDKSGLITRMFDTLTEGMKDVIDKAGPGDDSELLRDVKSSILIDFTTGTNLKNGSISILDEYILDLEEEIVSQEEFLLRIEDRYYSQYSAMETALSQMNQQSSWLMSQLGGM